MTINKRIIAILAVACAVVGIFAGLKISQQSNFDSPKPKIIIVEPVLPDAQTINSDILLPPIVTPLPIEVVSPSSTEITTRKPDEISAKAYLVGNITTSHIYSENNSSSILPVASISKLITALTAMSAMSSTTRVTITEEEATVPPDGSNIAAGETYSITELLYPLLLSSSNIAAEAIASSRDRVAFPALMSSYSLEIGMLNTSFADPSGLSSYNRSTAKDLFTLAKYLYDYRPDILALTRTYITGVATTTDHGSHIFSSIHPFANDPRFIGGKTGRTTAAGETMMTILNINGQSIVFIVLGSDIGTREHDTRLLIDKVSGLI